MSQRSFASAEYAMKKEADAAREVPWRDGAHRAVGAVARRH